MEGVEPPELNYVDDQKNISQYCKTHTNTAASKWTAAFRRIFLQSITRTILVEFVGAPPHYCFEEYEVNISKEKLKSQNTGQALVRLLDETGIELLHHATIKASEMKKEIIDGKAVYFGEYNFTGLEYGVDYIPSVIPVEMSSDGRCLCPTSEQHGACSCIAADWKRVRLQHPTTVLLVYSHDCPQHDAAVLALAELLRDTFKMDVHLDVWDENDIEKNLNEYINASIVKADKIIVINSIGAYYRVRARYLGDDVVERVHKTPLDGLFLSQIDLVLQHARVISARFSYTPSSSTLFALSPLLQYTIPENLSLFVASLSDSQMRNDPRLAGFNPHLARLQTAIGNMSHMIESDPKWFEKSHHRVRRDPIGITSVPRPLDSDTVKELSSPEPAVQPLPFGGPMVTGPMSPPAGAVVVAAPPLEEDARPLLEEESEEMAVVEEQPAHDDSSADSAFHSASVVDEIAPVREVLDKPRLSDLTKGNPMDLHGEMVVAVIEPPGQKHQSGNSNDSGMVSDLNSGQLST
ncbi:SEFIR domain protein [Teladorsagia circumcincta]|uniref:SEFIR domain protein n=1 Tax=Teladorsagia circumcincta TaxID=45464 RepID=A0A2G9TWL5_TELCI|nr:SEFIR domain protein [Teladorsagia circumcincta]